MCDGDVTRYKTILSMETGIALNYLDYRAVTTEIERLYSRAHK